jgi:hypothetical protein
MEVFFFFEKYQNRNFGEISKFLELIVFGQILAILGDFRQFWADFATLADNMPKLRLKS